MNRSVVFPFLGAVIALSIIAIVSALLRPLFPVDETRYLTVAWEMFSKGEWVLPTLNFEPYHHKPPLLFWMIMGLWNMFGVSQQVAMLVPYIIFAGVIGASIYLVKSLVPNDKIAPIWMTALTLGSLPLLLYSNIILFDLLLSMFVIVGLASVWNFAQTGLKKHLIIFAICVGLGALAKGPVILLNLLFPVILARFWIPKNQMIVSRGKWTLGFLLAIIGGVFIALSWAIPAAMMGGAEYTNKIFWGQTAGRVEQSFDHARPVWWYVQLLPLLLCPWILMPSLWRNIKNWSELSVYLPMNAIRFLAVCIIPIFISFSLISGKQIHYLFPCLIGVLAFIGIIFSNARYEFRPKDLWFPAGFILFLTALPAITKFFAVEMSDLFNRHLMDDALMRMSATISLIGVVMSGTLFFLVRHRAWHIQLVSLAVGMVIFMGVFHLEASRGFYKNYDLEPMAKVIAQYRDHPMAFLRNYHGEWGFLARVERPVEQIEPEQLPEWFKRNPTGIAFFRTSCEDEFRGLYDVIFEMPYKMNNVFVILVPKGQGKEMGKKFSHMQQ